jgi:glycosyltransferase involved in cell wall biosynthesis
VCIVTETYPPEINGVALTLARLADGLRRRGTRVSVVCPRQPTWIGGKDDAAIDRDVMRVPGVALPGYRQVRVGLPAFGALHANWISDRPDAVYVATEGPLGWSAVRAARRLQLPVFSGFHTNFPAYVRHYGAGLLAPLALAYLRRFHNRTRGTLAASPALREALAACGFENLRLLGRGVDGDRFAPCHRSAELRRAWGAGSDDLVALYVGRLAVEKNIPLAVEAHRAMARVGRMTRLVIVGDGPLRGDLERAGGDVIVCGMRSGADLGAHYASADVFLFPSETETFGNVTLEAMSSGLAVVAYDYAAARIHIVSGESGMLAPRGDARAFIAAATALAERPEHLPGMRRAARARVAALGWERVVDGFESFLAGVAVEGGDSLRDAVPAAAH